MERELRFSRKSVVTAHENGHITTTSTTSILLGLQYPPNILNMDLERQQNTVSFCIQYGDAFKI